MTVGSNTTDILHNDRGRLSGPSPPMAPPSWLQSAAQKSPLSLALHTLEHRERQREAARLTQHWFLSSTSSPQAESTGVPAYIRAHYSCAVGQLPAHKHKNRYIALEPYDRTRVKVPYGTADNGRDDNKNENEDEEGRYINANWVRELWGGKYWIAAQAPLPHTCHAFLTLCMTPSVQSQQRVHTIVQLTIPVENGRRRAHKYFSAPPESVVIHPETESDSLLSIHIRVDSEEDFHDSQCVLTDLRLKWYNRQQQQTVGEEFQVTHLLYSGWPDFGVPTDNESILNFTRLVERVNNRLLNPSRTDPNASPPILVHCSAGVGRTGSFIALSSILRAHSLLTSHRSASNPSFAPSLPPSPLGSLPSKLKTDLVAQEIDALREQRQGMVQREEQAAWVYQSLIDAFNGL